MRPRLVLPSEVAEEVRRQVEKRWVGAVHDELDAGQPFTISVQLRTGLGRGADLGSIDFDDLVVWATAWNEVGDAPEGVSIMRSRIPARHLPEALPARLAVTGLDAALGLVVRWSPSPSLPDIPRARRIAWQLRRAGAVLTPGTLRRVCDLTDVDVATTASAVHWLDEHPDVREWSARQLPVPGMHSKWLVDHGSLLCALTGRDIPGEVRPRPAVVHVTYVDPAHLASGRRRHDAWTAGDGHELAYLPRTVVVVENRDSRLWFPPFDRTVVVEGGGDAAAHVLADVPWIRRATTVAYWGDMDVDGFAILDRFRAAMTRSGEDGAGPRPVVSLLMDGTAFHRYARFGVNVDRMGRPLGRAAPVLSRLTDDEAAGYAMVATRGPVDVRRIEQERIPLPDAAAALQDVLGRGQV